MEESFRHIFKEYFSFMKKDRNGVLVLMVLIVFAIAGNFIVKRIEVIPRSEYSEAIKAYEKWENENGNKSKSLSFFPFNPNTIPKEQLDSLNLPQFVKYNIVRYREAGGKFKCTSDVKKIYGMNDSIFNEVAPWLQLPDSIAVNPGKKDEIRVRQRHGTFDPNSASTEELTRFGFDEFQVSNIKKYRTRGGQFDLPGDIMKIYGVDSDFYVTIKEHIQIKTNNEINSLPRIMVELNSADSLELVKLRGIGPVFASRIIKYRNLLGGYYSVEQLLEVYGFPEETYLQLKENFEVDTLLLNKIRINFAGYAELIRHPYIEKIHTEALLDYREKYGPFASEKQLFDNGMLDSVSYLKIKPYLTCR